MRCVVHPQRSPTKSMAMSKGTRQIVACRSTAELFNVNGKYGWSQNLGTLLKTKNSLDIQNIMMVIPPPKKKHGMRWYETIDVVGLIPISETGLVYWLHITWGEIHIWPHLVARKPTWLDMFKAKVDAHLRCFFGPRDLCYVDIYLDVSENSLWPHVRTLNSKHDDDPPVGFGENPAKHARNFQTIPKS